MRFLSTIHSTILALALIPAALAPSGHAVAQSDRQSTSAPYIVVLDAGHGGADTGAADVSQTEVEKVLTLAVAKRARTYLKSMGYRVYIDRSRDQAVNTPPRDLNGDGTINQEDEFTARNLYANAHHADVFVSIHFDASTSPTTHGTHGYYCPARPFWHQSKRLADLIAPALSTALRGAGYVSPNNGVQTDVADVVPQARADYPWFLVLGPTEKHFVIGTAMPGALIESLYLSSPRDAAALRKPSIIAALGHGYANGIRAYFAGKTSRR